MNIAHIGAFNGRNLGDSAIRESMRQMLEALEPGIAWRVIDCQSTRFDAEVIAGLNDWADLVIVGGGGLFWDRPENESVSGWQWNIATADIEKIKPPLVVYAVGWNQFPYNDLTSDHPEIFTSIAALYERADLFSVRNAGTRNATNFGAEVVPDPAFFLRADPYTARLEGVPRLCWAADRPTWRWPSEESRRGWRAWARGHAPHGITHVRSVQSMSAGQLATVYADAPLVIGMRKHSLIIPLGQGTPVISLGNHFENLYTMRDVGLSDWCVTAETHEEADRLVERALNGEQPAIPLAEMRATVDDFNIRVLALAR